MVLDTLSCEDAKAARARCVDLAMCLMSRSQMYHGHDAFLAQILNDSFPDDRKWLAGVLNEGLGIAVPIGSWSDAHASQAEFLLRRNLLGLQRTGQLISDPQLQQDGSPFAVFWPNPGDGERDKDVESIVHKLSSIVEEVPKDSQMAVVVDLARAVESQA